MKFAKPVVLGFAAFALAAGSAWAAPDKSKDTSTVGNVTRSDDSGFAKLDKNKDGYISKTESLGEATLGKDFGKWDMNNDGKINRAEYLAAMAKEDAVSLKDKVKDKMSSSKDSSSSTGSSKSKSGSSTSK